MSRSVDDAGRPRRVGLAWSLFSAVGSALMVIPWKRANEVGDPAHAVLILLSVAALGSTGMALSARLGQRKPPRRSVWVNLGVALALAGFTLAGNSLSALAIRDLSPALLNVLLRAEVPLVAIFGWLLLGERVERRFWVGAAVAGVGLVVLQGLPFAAGPRSPEPGTLLAVGASACFGALVLMTRFSIQRIDPVVVNALRLWIAVALWFGFNEVPDWERVPREQWVYATLAAIAGPFLGRLALMFSSRFIEARLSTLASLTAPVMTLGLAYLLLGHWPESHQLAGGAIMLVGISLPLLGAGRRA